MKLGSFCRLNTALLFSYSVFSVAKLFWYVSIKEFFLFNSSWSLGFDFNFLSIKSISFSILLLNSWTFVAISFILSVFWLTHLRPASPLMPFDIVISLSLFWFSAIVSFMNSRLMLYMAVGLNSFASLYLPV